METKSTVSKASSVCLSNNLLTAEEIIYLKQKRNAVAEAFKSVTLDKNKTLIQ